jgi:Tfp pilus assembly protein PilO
MNSKTILKQLEIIYKRRKKIILPLLFLLVLVIGYYSVLKDPLDGYLQTVDLVKSLDKRIVQADAVLSSSKQYEKKIIELSQTEKNLMSMALPERPEYPSLITHLTSLARKSGFFVTSMDIEDLGAQSTKENSNKNLGKLLVKMKLVGGGYNELKEMVSLLQESVMMNDIYSVNFSNKNPIYELNLVVYYANPNGNKK